MRNLQNHSKGNLAAKTDAPKTAVTLVTLVAASFSLRSRRLKPAPTPVSAGTSLSIDKCGFSLIELLVVVFILGGILIFAADQYISDVEYVRKKRAMTELEEIAKTIRLYNIREDRPFTVATLSASSLGSMIGTYFEKEPPADPWGRAYRHNAELGVAYSIGPDAIDGFKEPAADSGDDVAAWYLPRGFFITKAEWVDVNKNINVDFGDYIEVFFSRPGKVLNPTPFDFLTGKPEKALGSAVIGSSEKTQSIQIILSPPVMGKLKVGETTIRPRPFIESIRDFSAVPQILDSSVEVPIIRRKIQ